MPMTKRPEQIDARLRERQVVALERHAVALERIADSLETLTDGEWADALLNIAEAAERLSPPPPETAESDPGA